MIDGVWEVSEERLYHCYEEVNRIARLIGQIDRINEIESHESQLQKSSFDLLELTQQVAGTFQALLIEKGIECAINGEVVLISADRDKIHQVVTNLLYNAIKFTPSGGQGIGLSIVKGIVNAHHGNISVESTYGKGTTFVVSLPLESHIKA